MPIQVRESAALKLAALISQLLALKDGMPPSDLDADEIKLVVSHRRARLLNDIENLGVQVVPDLPAREPLTATEIAAATAAAAIAEADGITMPVVDALSAYLHAP